MPSERSKKAPESEAADTTRDADLDADLFSRALVALDAAPKASALLDLARDTWIERAATGRTVSPDEVRDKSAELDLVDADGKTSLGNAIGALGRGPEDDAERALGAALCARSLAREWASDSADDAKLAAAAITLSARTGFDVLGGLDKALDSESERAWKAVAERVRAYDDGEAKGMSRGDAALACAALATSSSTAAARARAALRVEDATLSSVLSGAARASGPGETFELSGELLPTPRGPVATALLGLTGLLFVRHTFMLATRLALGYRRPAEVTLSNGGVRVRSKITLLGRTLRERETHIPKDSLAQATREVKYPSLGLYAGLLALALGSYVGVGTLSDGVRSASPSLLLVGLLIVAAGIGLDLALTSAAPGARGRCRVIFIAKKGHGVCVGGLDSARADAALATLKA